MDTATHVMTGVGLAGLSFLDPTMANHPELLSSMLFCTIVGSNAPDIDIIHKWKGNDIYVQKHRGFSHSIPAQAMLIFCIAGSATMVNGGLYFSTFLLWTCLAVLLHVISDIFNIYGTQALRPLRNTWIALNILPIFDPFIMSLHLLGTFLWLSGLSSGIVFSYMYILIFIYVLLRYVIQRKIKRKLLSKRDSGVTYTLIPMFRVDHWGIIASLDDRYKLGKYENGCIIWSKDIMKADEKSNIIRASKKNTFVHFIKKQSDCIHAKIIEKMDGYEVHWYDLRYQSRIDEPYVAIIKLDQKLNFVNSEIKRGFIRPTESAE
ncbi:metal-dependent hydrolase [Bacillus sp. HNG]|uniref:metal-dependent hydrolase n=1 Tax=Bacillus sp. HNG TaxID=2293325 RepID=UPI000E2E5DCB|nr:metal-dependent hydrolase [Bacillus sp. HNG]RFB09664.1 metal-dependent hydrolase [Bacillus sp. HNG]